MSEIEHPKKRKLYPSAEGQQELLQTRKKKSRSKKVKTDTENQSESNICKDCKSVHEDFFSLVDHKCRPFSCPACAETFASEHDLVMHKRIHTKTAEELVRQNNLVTSPQSVSVSLTIDSVQSSLSLQNLLCQFCNSSFGTLSLLAKHERLCSKRRRTNCVLCKKRLHPHNKRQYCQKCKLSIIDKNNRDYFLRKNIQLDENQSMESAFAENVSENSSSSEYVSNLHPLRCKETNDSDDSVTSAIVFPRGTLGSNEGSGKSELSTSLLMQNGKEHTASEAIPETKVYSNQNRRSDIIIRKMFDKSRDSLSFQKSQENATETKSEEVDSPTIRRIKRIRKPSRKKKENGTSCPAPLKSNACSKSKQELHKGPLGKEKASTAAPFLNLLDAVIKKDCRKEETTLFVKDMKVESLIRSLPDTASGILFKCSSEDDVNYRCVKCRKIFRSAKLGSLHFSSCKARLQKTTVSMNGIVYLCTLCHYHFTCMAELLKHKMSCTSCSVQKSSNNAKKLTHFINDKEKVARSYMCKKCGYSCVSPIIFQQHLCKERLKRMSNCYVKVDQIRKLDVCEGEKFTYFHCYLCEKDFCELYLYHLHMKRDHARDLDRTVKPLSVQVKMRSSVPNIKREPGVNSNCGYMRSYSRNSAAVHSRASSVESRSDPVASPLQSRCSSQLSEPVHSARPKRSLKLEQFQIPVVHDPSPIDEKLGKKFFGCDCPSTNSAGQNEDVKPCLDCLQKFCSKFVFDHLGIKPQTAKSISKKRKTKAGSQTRLFPTPPSTPEIRTIHSHSSTESSSYLEPGPSTAGSSEEPLVAGQSTDFPSPDMAVEDPHLNLMWNHDPDDVDAFAVVASENLPSDNLRPENLPVIRYVCAHCFVTVNKDDLLNHVHVNHNRTSDVLNVSYVKQRDYN